MAESKKGRGVTDVRLTVGGTDFTAWRSWEIESDVLTPADAWSLTAVNAQAELAGAVSPGDAIKLTIDGVRVMTGVVDDVRYRTDAQGSTVELVGRDGFAPMVDCSAAPKAWRKVTLKTLGESLGAPLGVTTWRVQSGVTLSTHDVIKIDPGETPAEVLTRVAKKDGLLFWFTPDGAVEIGLPDYSADPTHKLRLYCDNALAQNNNILEATVTQTWRDRFGTLTVAGASNDYSEYQSWASYVKHAATDAEVDAARALITVDSSLKTKDKCKRVAEDEVSRRAMEALTIEAVVRGHYGTPYDSSADPELYAAGQMMDVIYEPGDISGKYWCSKRRFLDGPEGPRTELTLHPGGWLQR